MKKIFLVSALSFVVVFTFAQSGEWVWLHGASTTSATANYGTQGIASDTSDPSACYAPCQWTDTNGNFWLYGGMVDSSGDRSGDLWKYDPVTNLWTWMKGSGILDDPGSYGTKGVPSPLNNPPALSHGVTTWTDLQNNLWLFGGWDANSLFYNDLWEYNISTNEWTWVNGYGYWNDPGFYGTQGVPNPANIPPGRADCAASWVAANGDLWLFGGNTSNGQLSDMWKYNIASNLWTWKKGPKTMGVGGTYGTLGVESAANNPGARSSYAHWKDSIGNFWLFGGGNFLNEANFNDLWRFNPSTNSWTWMNGSEVANVPGNYGSKCRMVPSNAPSSRYENRACWTDANGNFWFFGGFVDQDSANVTNDLWMYCVQTNQWIWESNDSIPDPSGTWGMQGVSSPANKPNGRGGSVGWADNAGHLYLFGGSSQSFPDSYNDLWKFTIDSVCSLCNAFISPPIASLSSTDTTFCAFNCVNFTSLSSNATSWQWTFQGGSPPSSTDENPQNICYLTSGNFDVRLVVSNSGGFDTITINSFIKVIAAPPTPTITQHSDTLYCSTDPTYTSYQWYSGTTLIAGATDSVLAVSVGGNYNVQVTNEDGCKTAVGINIIIGIQNYVNDNMIYMYPNPASDQLLISGDWKSKNGTLTIFNTLGENIYSREVIDKQETVNCKSFPAGIYFVQVINENSRWVGRFVKE